MTLPDLHLSINGLPTPATDISFGATLGGYDGLTATIEESSARRLPSSVTQGSEVTLYTSAADVRFQGRLANDPQIHADGTASIKANGHRARADKESTDLLYQAIGTGWWTDANGDPHGYTAMDDKVSVEIRPGVMLTEIDNGVALAVNDRNGGVFWAPGVPGGITRVAFTLESNMIGTNNVLRLLRATGPSGARTVVADYTSTGAMATAVSGGSDLVGLEYTRLNTTATAGSRLFHRLKSLRVNGIASGDSLTAQALFRDIAARCGFDSAGVATLATNILPLYWQDGSWADLMDYTAMLVDGWYRVLDDRGSGPFLEANTWANSKVWTVTLGTGARAELAPLEKYNRVVVKYVGTNGKPRQVTATKAVPALDDKGLINAYEFELTEPQENATLAATVAANLATYLASDRYEGTIEWVDAVDSAGRRDPFGPLPGDLIVIADWDQGESLQLRLTGTTGTATGMTGAVGGDFPPTDRVVGIHDLLKKRRRRPARKVKRGRMYTGVRARQYRRYHSGDWGSTRDVMQQRHIYNWFRRREGKRVLTRKQYRRRFG